MFWSGAFVDGLHDAPAAAGDHHVAGFGESPSEELRHFIDRLVRLCARRAEDRHLAHVPVRTEDLGGEPHFLERGVHEFEVSLAGLFQSGFERS